MTFLLLDEVQFPTKGFFYPGNQDSPMPPSAQMSSRRLISSSFFANPANTSVAPSRSYPSPDVTTAPNGKMLIILGPPCFDEMFDFPKGSIPTAEIGAKFVLAHEMTHAFAFGNPNAFRSFKDHVDLPWTIFAGLSSNPIIRRNAFRSLADEVFADVIPAYIYSKGLLNQQMSDWLQTEMPGTLK